MKGEAVAVALLLLLGPAVIPRANAEDRVTLFDARNRLVTRTGTIIQCDAKELQLQLPQGTTHRVRRDRIVSIETERCAEHEAADEAFVAGDDAGALSQYRAAYRVESRPWVQQQIVARSIVCLQQMGQTGAAATTFLALWQQDPETLWAQVIPLAWCAEQPDRLLEQKATGWLVEGQPAVARLMAGSWLLSGPQRAAAQRVLQDVVRREGDNWIGQVSAAQLWRTQVVDADAELVQRWQTGLQQLPAPQRAGPSFVIAQTLARQGDVDAAVLAYLQAAWSYQATRQLASESLWAAGQLLHGAQKQSEAVHVFRDLVRLAPHSPLADEAQRLIRQRDETP